MLTTARQISVYVTISSVKDLSFLLSCKWMPLIVIITTSKLLLYKGLIVHSGILNISLLNSHIEPFPPLFVQPTSLTMCSTTPYIIFSLLPEMQEVGYFHPPQVEEREKSWGVGGGVELDKMSVTPATWRNFLDNKLQ